MSIANRHNVNRPTTAQSVDLAICHTCQQSAGNPCRTPSGRTTRPHVGRVEHAWSILINRAYMFRTYGSQSA